MPVPTLVVYRLFVYPDDLVVARIFRWLLGQALQQVFVFRSCGAVDSLDIVPPGNGEARLPDATIDPPDLRGLALRARGVLWSADLSGMLVFGFRHGTHLRFQRSARTADSSR